MGETTVSDFPCGYRNADSILADSLSRIVVSPAELPIGIVMSLLGGPFFLVVLLKNSRKK
jgi:ABC-type Fe3+-siderophore transport system permease subunit